MLERCVQMADAFLAHLLRVAANKGDAAKAAAAAALTRDALLANIHYFRVRDHVEQVGAQQGSRRRRAAGVAGTRMSVPASASARWRQPAMA